MQRRHFIALSVATAAAAALPRFAFGQQPAKLPRVAYFQGGYAELPPNVNENSANPEIAVFFKELARLGFVEGRTVTIDRYNGFSTNAQQTLQAVVQSAPDLIFVASATSTGAAAVQLTKTIPIVVVTADPLNQGIVTNLAHPGGNVTAISLAASSDSQGKGLSILAEAIPTARRVAYIAGGGVSGDQALPTQSVFLKSSTDAALKLGLSLIPVLFVSPPDEAAWRNVFERVVAAKVDMIQFDQNAGINTSASLVAGLALEARMPSISPYLAVGLAGGLISYGSNRADSYRLAANHVALILNGAKPGDLPVLQATLFDFVVNLKTAKALGLTLPPSILLQATQVIE